MAVPEGRERANVRYRSVHPACDSRAHRPRQPEPAPARSTAAL